MRYNFPAHLGVLEGGISAFCGLAMMAAGWKTMHGAHPVIEDLVVSRSLQTGSQGN
jgi:hypothetical protein